jgi:hypothetical protein
LLTFLNYHLLCAVEGEFNSNAFEALERDFQDVLSELVGDKSLERFRLEYEKLHRALKKSHDQEKRLIKKVSTAGISMIALMTVRQTAAAPILAVVDVKQAIAYLGRQTISCEVQSYLPLNSWCSLSNMCPALLSASTDKKLLCNVLHICCVWQCRELNGEIVNNAAKVQTALKLSQEDQATISSLRKEIEKAWTMVDVAHEKEASHSYCNAVILVVILLIPRQHSWQSRDKAKSLR